MEELLKVDAGMPPRKVGTQGVAPVPLNRCDVAKLYAPTTQMPMDATSCTFLLEKDLVSGIKVSLTFLRERERRFLQRSVADQIPFSSDKLPSWAWLLRRLCKHAKDLPRRGAAEKDVYYYHSKQYAYAVYYCHKSACTLEAGRRIARVWVKGEDGRTVEAVAVCHKDTSAWIPNNIPFKALNVKPGTPSICLYVPQGDHLWQTAD
ncbi:uncharacterized protein LOC131874176 [Cryptomeria japonica]|uniref:uncharacterized protein LOC131874176 n=1 Tax=Cryptomeria japonica TaxID=3369 RepID=UPI0027DA2F29|nr:uncharacterized protein LOC131874176 [Cryptomeria japonica]